MFCMGGQNGLHAWIGKGLGVPLKRVTFPIRKEGEDGQGKDNVRKGKGRQGKWGSGVVEQSRQD